MVQEKGKNKGRKELDSVESNKRGEFLEKESTRENFSQGS